jgi:hypothetical protein
MYHYMLSYVDAAPPRLSHGNCDITLPGPIESMDHIARLSQLIRNQYGLTNPTIMAFSLFGEEGR